MQLWRFIDSGSLSGPENMAIDEALLQSFNPVVSRPIFRLYGWSPAALSLGRFQKAAGLLQLERCHAAGVPMVRRITGGGIIYHADELTYSIICSPDHIPSTTSIKDAYRVLTAFLLRFYRGLGLQAAYAGQPDRPGDAPNAFCFAGRETFDILLNGRKIGGNAQRRLKEVIFQHGSIPLLDRAGEALQYLREGPSDLTSRCTSLSTEGITTDAAQLFKGLRRSFVASLDAELLVDGLSDREQELAGRLLREKYLNPSWNLQGEVE